MAAAPGQKILKGRYRLVGPIGRGGMGDVWRALDTELGSDCAVKIMRDSADTAALDLFTREQQVLAELRSPHVVSIYDRGTLEENGNVHPFFVMPLLQGSTLAALIKESSNRITVEWLVDIIRQGLASTI